MAEENGITMEGNVKINGEEAPAAGKLDLVVLAQGIVDALFADLEHRNGHQAVLQGTNAATLAAHKDMWVTIAVECILQAIVGAPAAEPEAQENAGEPI